MDLTFSESVIWSEATDAIVDGRETRMIGSHPYQTHPKSQKSLIGTCLQNASSCLLLRFAPFLLQQQLDSGFYGLDLVAYPHLLPFNEGGAQILQRGKYPLIEDVLRSKAGVEAQSHLHSHLVECGDVLAGRVGRHRVGDGHEIGHAPAKVRAPFRPFRGDRAHQKVPAGDAYGRAIQQERTDDRSEQHGPWGDRGCRRLRRDVRKSRRDGRDCRAMPTPRLRRRLSARCAKRLRARSGTYQTIAHC
jgi:hypothetical protein